MAKKHNSIIAVLLLALLVGCSTWTTIDNNEAHNLLKQGDEIRIVSKDGKRHKFAVTEVTPSGEIIGANIAVSIHDLALIERKSIDAANTGLAIGGGLLLALILLTTASVAALALFGF